VIGRDADPCGVFGPDAFDVVVDVVGGAGWWRVIDALRPGGHYVVAGAIAGPVVELDLRTLYLKDLRLVGATIVEPEVFACLLARVERGEVRPPIAAVHDLAQIVEAQRQFESKRFVGKIVLDVAGARPAR
jgi:NADPH:quinone reductase-like Zn-dependent oxidoreductase